VVITQLHDKMVSTYKDLLLSFMKQDYVNQTPLHLINIENVEQYIPITQIYLGIKVLKEIEKPSINSNKELLNDFYLRVQQFLKIACLQIKKKYDFSNPLMLKIDVIDIYYFTL